MLDMKRGKLIVIEGCDGAGKETQVKMLLDNLKALGREVATVSFPRYDDTVAGRIIKYILKSEEGQHLEFSKLGPEVASLYYAADRRESKEYLESLLLENDYVILDRYFTANILHQGAKYETEVDRNAYIDKFEKIEIEILGIPKANLIFYLDIPLEIVMKRIEKRSISGVQKKDQHEGDSNFIKNSIQKGRDIAKYAGWNIVNGTEIRGDEIYEFTREEVQSKIVDILSQTDI